MVIGDLAADLYSFVFQLVDIGEEVGLAGKNDRRERLIWVSFIEIQPDETFCLIDLDHLSGYDGVSADVPFGFTGWNVQRWRIGGCFFRETRANEQGEKRNENDEFFHGQFDSCLRDLWQAGREDKKIGASEWS